MFQQSWGNKGYLTDAHSKPKGRPSQKRVRKSKIDKPIRGEPNETNLKITQLLRARMLQKKKWKWVKGRKIQVYIKTLEEFSNKGRRRRTITGFNKRRNGRKNGRGRCFR